MSSNIVEASKLSSKNQFCSDFINCFCGVVFEEVIFTHPKYAKSY